MATISDTFSKLQQGEISTEDLQQIISQDRPDFSDDRVQRISNDLELLAVVSAFPNFPSNSKERILKSLNWRSLKIFPILGVTGVGKSTVLQSLTGRPNLFPDAAGGKAVTGCSLEAIFDISSDQNEYASVNYFSGSELIGLLKKYFIKPFGLDRLLPNPQVSSELINSLRKLQANANLDPDRKNRFEDLRDTFIDVFLQFEFVQNQGRDMPTRFNLNDATEEGRLGQMIREDSELNQLGSETRMVCLIKSVTFHLQPDPIDTDQQLPSDIIFKDVPGISGSEWHNIIISEVMAEATAAMFVVAHQRFADFLDNKRNLENARQCITFGDSQSADRVFVVVNGIDAADDLAYTRKAIAANMSSFLQKLAPDGYFTRYYMVSALTAVTAQKLLREEFLSPNERENYEFRQAKLGVAGGSDVEILEATGIPQLKRDISQFLLELDERELNDSERILSLFIMEEIERLSFRKDQLTEGQSEDYQSRFARKQLASQKKKVESKIRHFRCGLLDKQDKLRQQIRNRGNSLCNEIDAEMANLLPQIWEENYISIPVEIPGRDADRPFYESMMSDLEGRLWECLLSRSYVLADVLIVNYQENIESAGLVEQVTKMCFGSISPVDMRTRLLEAIQVMREKIKAASEGFLLQNLTASESRLTYFEEKGFRESPVLKVLREMPKKKNHDEKAFSSLMKTLRQHYEPYFLEQFIESMLNLMFYEMLRAERSLLSWIEGIFDRLGRLEDPYLTERIYSEVATGSWRELEEINKQLATLQTLKLKPSTMFV